MSKLYHKYHITHSDGTPVDPKAEYFVLRIDKDPDARMALRTYIDMIAPRDPEFAKELQDWVMTCESNASRGTSTGAGDASNSQRDVDSDDYGKVSQGGD